MKNFDWTQFTRKMHIDAPIQKIYDAWSKPAEIERWFLKQACYFDKEEKLLSKNNHISEGLRYEWDWYLYDITEKGKIIFANQKDHIQFTFAGNCIVDITIKEFENGTIVTLKQKNIPTDDDSKCNIRLGCDSGCLFI